MSQPEHEEEAPVLEGPDPRDWERQAPEMWGLVLDIEALDRILAAMNGPAPQDSGPAYEEARLFLRHSGQQLRGMLGVMILQTYGVPLPETGTSPFEGAGKPRAFGAGNAVPPGNA